jgi:hypothetical protein
VIAAAEVANVLHALWQRRWPCADCVSAPDLGPMLHDDVWLSIARDDEFLCLPCIEWRLGRPLTESDLVDCLFNAGWIAFDPANLDAQRFAFGRRRLGERKAEEDA